MSDKKNIYDAKDGVRMQYTQRMFDQGLIDLRKDCDSTTFETTQVENDLRPVGTSYMSNPIPRYQNVMKGPKTSARNTYVFEGEFTKNKYNYREKMSEQVNERFYKSDIPALYRTDRLSFLSSQQEAKNNYKPKKQKIMDQTKTLPSCENKNFKSWFERNANYNKC